MADAQGPSLNMSPLPPPHPPTIFLFGGKLVTQRRLTAEMWAFDVNSRTWSRVNAGKGPGARYFHSMDVWEDKLVCFGGMADNDPHSEKLNVHNDVWLFDCSSRRWLPQPSPEAPISPAAVQDPELVPTPRYAHLSAISRGKLIVCGGQRMDNSWIYEMNVYDLTLGIWVSKTEQPVSHGLHSKGAYRSVTASSPLHVVVPSTESAVNPASALPYTVEEEGSGGNVWCYSNYDFAKVRRELEVLSPLDGQAEEAADPASSDKYTSPPGFSMRDLSTRVSGSSQPPGLRFPTGGIVGNHFVLCGLYLASTSAAFSIWTLNLTTHRWKHIEPPVLASGSWNIVVLDAHAARLLIFGNAGSDLATDYSKRAVSLNHVAVIELEAYGVYQAPRLLLSDKTQDMGLSMLDEKLVSDFDIVCEDGRRIKCSRKVLADRWPWFAEQQAALVRKANDVVQEMPSLDITDALLGSLSPARFTPNRLHLPEPLPVCVALIQYFYTLNLSTPLQTRAPVLSALLFLSKQYKIERLNKLVVHALHCRLDHSNAVGVYEVATLAGEHNLAARALSVVNPKGGSSRRDHSNRRPGSVMTSEGSQGSHQQPTSAAPTQAEPPATAPASTAPQSAPTDVGEHIARALRVRSESPTLPEDVFVTDPMASCRQSTDALTQLLDALTIESLPVRLIPLRPAAITIPSPSPPSSRPTSRSSNYSTYSSLSPRTRRLPPMLPPPHKPLPGKPADQLLTPSTPLSEDLRALASSPTNSEVTSICPRTPSDSSRSSRDSTFLARAHSPSTPSLSERRPSLGGTPTKQALPALPEDELVLDTSSCDTHSRLSSDVSEISFVVPSVQVTSTTAPLDGDLGSQQQRAIEALHLGSSKLTRAMSLSSITARPRSTLESRSRQARTFSIQRSRKSLQIMPKANSTPYTRPIRTHFDDTEESEEELQSLKTPTKVWSTAFSPLSLSPVPTTPKRRARPTSLFVPKVTSTTEVLEEEKERLEKFQAFIAEQQRSLGLSPSDAYDCARKATGKAGGSRSKLGRLGAKFADALMADRW